MTSKQVSISSRKDMKRPNIQNHQTNINLKPFTKNHQRKRLLQDKSSPSIPTPRHASHSARRRCCISLRCSSCPAAVRHKRRKPRGADCLVLQRLKVQQGFHESAATLALHEFQTRVFTESQISYQTPQSIPC